MRHFTVSLSAFLALCGAAKAEQTPADRNIGSATLVEKSVEGLTAERNMRIKPGDAVFFNELLTTGQDARGAFLFDDRASLQMGPRSQVRLDNFVYAGAAADAPPAVAFNVTRGALRFMSAGPKHKPYEVRTNHATIGVRGTAFAVRSLETRTDAVLYEGAIEICLPKDKGGECRPLDKPCTTLAVTDAGFVETRNVGAKDWTFDAQCRPKPAPGHKRRHGAAEPPADPPAPPPIVTRRAAREPIAPPKKVRIADIAPPRLERARPDSGPPEILRRKPRPRDVVENPKHPRFPRRPHRPVYDGPEIDDGPYYPPPRVVRFPIRPPIVFGGGPWRPWRPSWRPHFPGGGWGGYPQGPRGGGGDRGPISRGGFGHGLGRF